jgi:GAF domain-containing protein
MSPHREPLATEVLEQVLATEGVHGALRFLNARAPHRFTGVYRLDPPTLHNVQLFDRENPTLQVGADAPMRETYCSITGSGAAPFATADARSDARLTEHPARESTLSYCGVPLLDPSGTAVGTLCHFDLTPRTIPHPEIALMQSAAPGILRALRESGAFPPG